MAEGPNDPGIEAVKASIASGNEGAAMKTAEYDRETLRSEGMITLPGEEIARKIGYFQDGVIEIGGLRTCTYEKIEDGKIRLSYRPAAAVE